jgi:D-alanyl-D-alanine carboxypeptidase
MGGKLAFACRALAAVSVALGFLALTARADARLSSIVIDADTGQALSVQSPDAINYPASLTKMMTLYLTFRGIEDGKLKLDQRFTVTAHAAAQAPSKLGLEIGESIALRDLVFAVITHSANDAAVVIAENIAGSEPAFAQRMTEQAHRLGMSNTHFANASGLPNPDNTTTARDLAALARALYRDFPKEYPWFATEEYSFRGVNYANHNHLMSSFAGMDGIKTGYIRASGFNLAASAVRDGRRLIAVVMGGESAHSRDLKMASLLDQAFARPAGGGTEIVEDETPSENPDSLAHRAGRALAQLSPVGKAEAAINGRVGDGWSIQVGAFTQHDAAEHAAELAQHIPGAKGHAVHVIDPAHGAKDKVFRARLVHFTHHDALAACRTLHKRHHSCSVVAPDAQLASAK